MKRINLIMVFLFVMVSLAFARDDFGLRLSAGYDKSESISNYELGINLDCIVLPNVYLLMGASFLFPHSQAVEVAINSLGLEYSFPFEKHKFVLGSVLNRSYIRNKNRQGIKAISFHVGYKHKWLEWIDLMLYGGIVPEALVIKNPDSASGNAYFLRTAVELYF